MQFFYLMSVCTLLRNHCKTGLKHKGTKANTGLYLKMYGESIGTLHQTETKIANGRASINFGTVLNN